jgi:DNA-binding LacI/PurR family transcriptional regulator
MKLPPTQLEVARAAGVTQACVSLALAGSARITAATRERVLDCARACGYLPDLALSALAKRRWHGPRSAPIVYLRSRMDSLALGQDRYLLAAQARCQELGLRLVHIERGRDDDRAVQKRLEGMGPAGVIVGQSTLLEQPRRLAWERLRAVHCGLIVPPESGDVVCPDLTSAVHTAWRRMNALGYQRIAAVHFADPRAYSEQLLAGALLALERVVGDPRRLRVWIGSRRELPQARTWLRTARTDAVLGYDPEVHDQLRQPPSGPGLPFAALVNISDRSDVAGMQLPFAAVAEVAVDLLADRLRERPGAPPQRRLHLIEMPWCDGPSLPALPALPAFPARARERALTRR